MYKLASQSEFPVSTPRNLIGRRMTPTLSPRSILPPPPSQNVFAPSKKNKAHV